MVYSAYDDSVKAMIADFLQFLNQHCSDYVASSGTGANLWLGGKYGRYTEDVNLDFLGGSTSRTAIVHIIQSYCGARDYKMQCTLGRVDGRFVTFEVSDTKLGAKIDVVISFRLSMCNKDALCTKINGVLTYDLDSLVSSLCIICTGDTIQNIYDIVMLCKLHWDKFAPSTKLCVASKFAYIDLSMIMQWLEKYDREGIDIQMLRCDVRALYEKLGF